MMKNMKKIFYYLVASVVLTTVVGCSDAQFEEYYFDPSQTTTVSCDKLMTGVFWSARKQTMGEIYWRYIFDKTQIGTLAQTMGFQNSQGRYAGARNYAQNRWQEFYNTLTQYRVLQETYNQLSEENKTVNEVYELLARTFIYHQLQEVVDIWGSAPFSEAGMLPNTGDLESAFPKYDDAADIYTKMIDELDEINTRLAALISSGLPSLTAGILPNQDYINKGDLTKWQRFANSLRLRMALRVASQGSLTAKGREVLGQMLSNPSKYPLVETFEQVIKIDPDNDAFKNDMGNPWGGVRGAFEDGEGEGSFVRASKAMIDILGVVDGKMTADSDPRTPVFVDSVAYGPNKDLYVGVNPLAALGTQETDWGNSSGVQYSRPSRVTFARNEKFPGIIFTAAETWFIKAEAFQQAWAQGDAPAAFKRGITESFNYYYWLNNASTESPTYPAPTATVTDAFAQKLWDKDVNKQKVILEQKWLNTALIDMRQSWADVRRTGYPELTFLTDNDAPEAKKPPYRLMYPDNEKTGNTVNWESVKAQDTHYTPIFWAKTGDYYSAQ
jgi:hypothetical protein